MPNSPLARPGAGSAWKRSATLACLLLFPIAGAQAQDPKIMRPEDGSALPAGEISIVATAPSGRLELDGKLIEAQEPFSNVFHAKLTPERGPHMLALIWEGGSKEIRFFTGDDPPAEYKAFQQHPPVPGVECAQCHGISRRGRFRFQGGCFDCHEKDTFVSVHDHPPHDFVECGTCHNAHGSTRAKHLMLEREIMCKLCHN